MVSRATAHTNGPKQYVQLGGRTVLAQAIKPFLDHPGINHVIVVVHVDDAAAYAAAIAPLVPNSKLLASVTGGATRQQSVFAGLRACAPLAPSLVLVHDAARPFVSGAVIDRVLGGLADRAGAIAALPLFDTLKRADADGRIIETISRDGLWRAQTPQGFHFEPLHAAHRASAATGGFDFTDDAAVAEWHGLDVTVVLGDAANIKLTTAEDFKLATRSRSHVPDIRTGHGFDVHRFMAGDHVWLCGVRVPHSQGVEAHSDGDVGLHALTDALLGAIADGDIGLHFKNTDPRWRGAASDQFLIDAVKRVTAAGGADHKRRCHRALRGAENFAVSRRHACTHGRDSRNPRQPRGAEGHDDRTPRICRSGGRSCRHGNRNRDHRWRRAGLSRLH